MEVSVLLCWERLVGCRVLCLCVYDHLAAVSVHTDVWPRVSSSHRLGKPFET